MNTSVTTWVRVWAVSSNRRGPRFPCAILNSPSNAPPALEPPALAEDSPLKTDEMPCLPKASSLVGSSAGSSSSKSGRLKSKDSPGTILNNGREKPFAGRTGLSTSSVGTMLAGAPTNILKDSVSRQKGFGVIVLILGGTAVKVMVPGERLAVGYRGRPAPDEGTAPGGTRRPGGSLPDGTGKPDGIGPSTVRVNV